LKDKSIVLTKWQKAELENLVGSHCIKRRIIVDVLNKVT
jgi:hypothetical protein